MIDLSVGDLIIRHKNNLESSYIGYVLKQDLLNFRIRWILKQKSFIGILNLKYLLWFSECQIIKILK